MGETVRLIEKFDRDSTWLAKNLEELREEYAGKYVAVKDKKVVDSDSEMETLLKRLKDEGINPSNIPINYVSKEPTELLL